MQSNTDTVILGAGISGLCVAHVLNKEHKSLLVLESSNQVGGAIQSSQADGYLAEHGPNSILVKDKRVATLLDDVGLNVTETLPAREEAKKRYIVHNGEPHAMPAGPFGMLKTPLFSFGGKLRFALEPFTGRYQGREKGLGEESFADFVRRRLGPDMLASAAGPFVSGIYAGDPEKLSVRHAFPRLWNLEERYRSFILGALALQFGGGNNPHRLAPSQMLSFNSGMHAMPKAIADHLSDDILKLDCKIDDIQKTDTGWRVCWSNSNGQHETECRNLVSTAPHHRLGEIPLPDSVSKDLAPVVSLDSPPVTSLVLGFRREDITHPLDGFGMLIKQSENSPLLGVLFSSSMFDGRAPEGHVTLTCMMGGTIHPEFAENSDETVLAELKRLLGVDGKPTFRHKTSWSKAIPQYGLGYQSVLDALENVEKEHSGLHFAGNYRGGISVGDCIVNGLELGKRIST
ncbi:MAG: protoporphyrinogen oxidase [Akkermansiaceae bacterium]